MVTSGTPQQNLENILKAQAALGQKSQQALGSQKMMDMPGTAAADRSPATQGKAAGMMAGASIAGLKPWSKDWVFEGQDENPDLKTLASMIGGNKTVETQMNPATKMSLADLQSQPKGKPVLLVDPSTGIAIEVDSMGTRGDQGAVSLQDLMHANPEAMKLRSQNMSEIAAALKIPNAKSEDAVTNEELAQLMSQISALNGSVEGMQLEQVPHPVNQRVLPSAVSGTDFLSTMNAANGVQNPQGKNASQFGSNMNQDQNGSQQFIAAPKPELRVIDGGLKGKRPGFEDNLMSSKAGLVTTGGLAVSHSQNVQMATPTLEVSGHVTTGANAQDRLTSESLLGVSSGIRTMAANGGGEMRIRLRPENLGELHVRVMTDGTQVGLQIQASDEKAKKIIEESIGHLKDSLASQSLSLTHMDISVANVGAGSGDMKQDTNPQQQNGFGQQFMSDMNGQNAKQGREGGSDGAGDRGYRSHQANLASSSAGAQARTSSAAASGRLDVMA